MMIFDRRGRQSAFDGAPGGPQGRFRRFVSSVLNSLRQLNRNGITAKLMAVVMHTPLQKLINNKQKIFYQKFTKKNLLIPLTNDNGRRLLEK